LGWAKREKEGGEEKERFRLSPKGKRDRIFEIRRFKQIHLTLNLKFKFN
jgi:hypothetical protein